MLGKYKNVQDLFVEGAVCVLPGGQPLWVQAMNPFQAEDARAAAHTARARIMLALREHGSDDEVQLRSKFAASPSPAEDIATYEANKKLPQLVEELRYDPEWIERLDMVEQHEALEAREATEAELLLIAEINRDYLAELGTRMEAEFDYQMRQLDGLDSDALYERYLEVWLDRNGNDRMVAEYELHEIYVSARACDATLVEGEWDHAACDHRRQVFESKADVRQAPTGLLNCIKFTLGQIAIGGGQGKGSASPVSSSASSATPSAEEGSTPSTPDATSSGAPGTSTPPSATP